MEFKELRNIVETANRFDIDKTGLFDNLDSNVEDFEVDNYRFVLESEAIDILIDMYKCDEYILGSFNAWFIADNCNIPIGCVEALQKADAYSELGELMLENGIDELIEEYVRLDGYGHAFNSYDGNNEEITLNGDLYIVFRV